jgi:hypothetical protein
VIAGAVNCHDVGTVCSDEPLSTPCPHGHDLLFAPGWWCDDCGCCAFPEMLRDADDEPDNDYD